MNRCVAVAFVAALSLCLVVSAQDSANPPASQPARQDDAAIAKAAGPSLVKVEYTLQYDQGESPKVSGYAERCPNCGSYHSLNTSSLVEEERPLEVGGFVLSPTSVVSTDPIIQARFLKGVQVSFGSQKVAAKIVAYGADRNAVFLELAQPLKEARPLAFVDGGKGPFSCVRYARTNGSWTTQVSSLSKVLSATEAGRQFYSVSGDSLIVTAKGEPVAVSMTEEMPLDDSWKLPPSKWTCISADEMAKLLRQTQDRSEQGLLRVALSFRSPKKGPGARFGARSYDREGEDEGTEKNAVGLLLDENTVAVLMHMKRDVTARLEAIKVYPAGQSEPVEAKFAGTLTDWGCLIAKLAKPVKGAPATSDQPIPAVMGKLLLSVELTQQGEKRTCHYGHDRIAACSVGYRGQLYPQIRGEDAKTYLFDPQGSLVAMPLSRRPKATTEDRYYGGDRGGATPVAYLKAVCGDLAKNTDPNNVPLTEEQENRLAWTGMVVQPLNRLLARENGVSQQTQDGMTGCRVAFVYPGSPADKAGIQAGHILLRLRFDDQPKPMEVRVDSDRFSDSPFPWSSLDQVPDQYFDRMEDMPTPWPSAGDTISRALTEIGFGKKFSAEFFIDGKVVPKDFTIEEGPATYDSAARQKSAELGVTVRDVTYELRRYFQLKDDAPGVIISKIEAGSKASIAGIKPLEIITQIDSKDVKNVKDFKSLLRTEGEAKLSILRFRTSRQVNIDMSAKTASRPAASRPARAPTPPIDPDLMGP